MIYKLTEGRHQHGRFLGLHAPGGARLEQEKRCSMARSCPPHGVSPGPGPTQQAMPPLAEDGGADLLGPLARQGGAVQPQAWIESRFPPGAQKRRQNKLEQTPGPAERAAGSPQLRQIPTELAAEGRFFDTATPGWRATSTLRKISGA